MSWADALNDIAVQIKQRLLAEDIDIDVYLGASSDTPSEEQICVIRGGTIEDSDVFCAAGMKQMIVYVEKWVRNDEPPAGATDAEMANNRLLKGYERLETVSCAMGNHFKNESYEAEFVKTLGDEDQYPPMTAERDEYIVNYKVCV